jgi:hypothetical protein
MTEETKGEETRDRADRVFGLSIFCLLIHLLEAHMHLYRDVAGYGTHIQRALPFS